MSKILEVNVSPKDADVYDIMIKENFSELKNAIVRLFDADNRLMLVFDTNTEKYFRAELYDLLKEFGDRLFSFTFSAGEINKSLDTVKSLYEELIQKNFERKDVILAVGGGVVGDLAGFASATYLRGIRFVQIPTTLLAMTDSSVGGKTGVDFLAYKNMVGAFCQPSLVYMSLSTLRTLPEREYLSGMAEVIKYGYIDDKTFLKYLEANAEKIIEKDNECLENIIYNSCRIKKEVVENDPLENGRRAILNFGHTIGHAIEKLMDFRLLHGECVALGMVAAMKIAVLRGLTDKNELDRLKGLLARYKLKSSLVSENLNAEAVLFATKSDKKMQGGRVKFILTPEIGRADIFRDVTDEEILLGIKEVFD